MEIHSAEIRQDDKDSKKKWMGCMITLSYIAFTIFAIVTKNGTFWGRVGAVAVYFVLCPIGVRINAWFEQFARPSAVYSTNENELLKARLYWWNGIGPCLTGSVIAAIFVALLFGLMGVPKAG